MATIDTARLQNLITALDDSKTALAAKGVTVPDGTLLDDIPGLIAQVPSGSPVLPTAQPKDVNFMDYDGTIRYSYTIAEASELTALPEVPAHSGLRAIGWNHTLAEVQALTKPCNIGAIYTSQDDKTHILLVFMGAERLSPNMVIRLSGTIKVDWGDGTVETFTANNSFVQYSTYSHTYAAPGKYEITIETVSGEWGGAYLKNGIFFISQDPANNNTEYYQGCIDDVVLGITADNQVSYATMSAFIYSKSARILAPYIMQWQDDSRNSLYTSGKLQAIHIPQGVTSIPNNAFLSCGSLTYLTMPESITSIGTSAFRSCGVRSLTLSGRITSIGSQAFSGCGGLTRLVLPGGLQTIEAQTFYTCGSMAFYDFTACSAVPTLANANAFTGIRGDCKIIVPDSLVSEWKAATNWATYADNIVGETEASA